MSGGVAGSLSGGTAGGVAGGIAVGIAGGVAGGSSAEGGRATASRTTSTSASSSSLSASASAAPDISPASSPCSSPGGPVVASAAQLTGKARSLSVSYCELVAEACALVSEDVPEAEGASLLTAALREWEAVHRPKARGRCSPRPPMRSMQASRKQAPSEARQRMEAEQRAKEAERAEVPPQLLATRDALERIDASLDHLSRLLSLAEDGLDATLQQLQRLACIRACKRWPEAWLHAGRGDGRALLTRSYSQESRSYGCYSTGGRSMGAFANAVGAYWRRQREREQR